MSKARPSKPKGSPLTPHANGQWTKRIRGKLYYFGPWDDHAGAVRRYLSVAADLHAGRSLVAPASGGDLTLNALADAFMTAKHNQTAAGELSPKTYQDYLRACRAACDIIGRSTPVSMIRPHDFGTLRAKLAETHGPVYLATTIRMLRTMFKWGWESEILDKPVRYGGMFDQPSRTVRRKAKRDRRTYSASECRALIDGASGQLKAMVLLGINCGFGQTDCADLTMDAVDLRSRLITFKRPKTGIDRQCALWAETAAAIKASRVGPTLVFMTRYLNPWVRKVVHRKDGDITKVVPIDSVSQEFTKLCDKAKVENRGFYTLRHTFRTVADDRSGDQHAIHLMMGHLISGMSGIYVERISVDRIRAVSNVVHDWLYGSSKPSA